MNDANILEGQYLTFQLNKQIYGMPIHAVKEIVSAIDIYCINSHF